MNVTDEMIEAALDQWFADPNWRENFASGPDVREYMRRSLEAALKHFPAFKNQRSYKKDNNVT